MADLVGMVGLWSEVAGKLGNFPARPAKMAAAVPRREKPAAADEAGRCGQKSPINVCCLPCTGPWRLYSASSVVALSKKKSSVVANNSVQKISVFSAP
jgi:hypothetical protein